MSRKHKPYILEQNTESTEGWRDPRTGVRLAPGALQNWPNASDQAYAKTVYKQMLKDEMKNSVFLQHPVAVEKGVA